MDNYLKENKNFKEAFNALETAMKQLSEDKASSNYFNFSFEFNVIGSYFNSGDDQNKRTQEENTVLSDGINLNNRS